ncbi:MAG: DUF6582 domain-containing protein [Mycobacterium sp.]
MFAFPKERKEPLTDATHVRNAVGRFDQVTDVSEEDRALAFVNIKKAVQHYNPTCPKRRGTTSAFIPNRTAKNREEGCRNADARRGSQRSRAQGGGHQRAAWHRRGGGQEGRRKPGAESAASDARRNEMARRIIAHELHLSQLSERRHGPKESL